MHVLIVSHNYPFKLDHTFGFFCKNQADALVSVGQQVGVVCPLLYSSYHIPKSKTILLGPSIRRENQILEYLHFLPSPPKLRRFRYWVLKTLGRKMIDRYIRNFGRPDIVHLHVFMAGEVAIYAKEKYGIPFAYTEHFTSVKNNQMSALENHLLMRTSNQACKRIAVSDEFKAHLEERLQLDFDYVPNVYDSNVFRPEKSVQRKEDFRFIHVAHINERKNQKRLLEAFAQAFSDNQKVSLKIIGDGADAPPFQELVKSLGLSKQVSVTGSRTPKEISQELQRSDAFVLSSDYETFGVSLIEAMACGLPVVSTRCGGPESIVVDPRLGILTDKSAEALSRGMHELYSNISDFDREYIAAYTQRQFSFEAIGNKLVNAYHQCVS